MSDSLSYSDASDDYPGGARLQEIDEDEAEPLKDNLPGPARPASPRSLVPSFLSNGKDTYQRPRRRDRDRDRHRSSTNPDLVRILVKEGRKAKEMRQVLSVALERLDRETRRAQEAERRALDLAERFKVVNDARLIAQQEASRLSEELSLHKLQLTHAQREIDRGSEVLKTLEIQRDDAEASAARARSETRKLREEKIKNIAREEGRRQGYDEGQRRGYEQGKLEAYSRRRERDGGAPGPDDYNLSDPTAAGGLPDGDARPPPLDGLPPDILNFASPLGRDASLDPRLDDLRDDGPGIPIPPPGTYNFDGKGSQGSRFRENLRSPGMSTLASLPLPLRSGAQPWPSHPSQGDPEFDHPQDQPSSPRRPNYVIPPEGYVPPVNADNFISIPPPHQLNGLPQGDPLSQDRRQEGSSGRPPSMAPSVGSRDYVFVDRQRASPQSFAQSMASTSLSNFDLLTSPRGSRRSGLTAIPEVSTSMEMSPGNEARLRSAVMPEPQPFPTPSAGFDDGVPGGSSMRASTPRTRRDSSSRRTRSQDERGYSNPSEVDEWRKSTANESFDADLQRSPSSISIRPSYNDSAPFDPRPSSATASRPPSHQRSRSNVSYNADDRSYQSGMGSRRYANSSDDISIQIEPPSGESSVYSVPKMRQAEMLATPGAEGPPRSPDQHADYNRPGVHRRSSSGSNHHTGSGYMQPGTSSPIFSPSPSTNRYYMPPSDSSWDAAPPADPSGRNSASIYGRHTPERTGSHRSVNETLRSKTPHSRPASSMGSMPPAQAQAPSPTNPHYVPSSLRPQYPDPANRVEAPSRLDTMSPHSMSSRHSAGHRRSASMNATAGMTPAGVPRPLASAGQPSLRRVPSNASVSSTGSRLSANYSHYNPKEYIDPAFLASSDDLTNMQSPNTLANTQANASRSSKRAKIPFSPSSSFSALHGSSAY